MGFASFLAVLFFVFGNMFSQTESYWSDEEGRIELVDYSKETSINGSVDVSFFATPGGMTLDSSTEIVPNLPDGLIFFNESWKAIGALIDSYENRTCSITPSTGAICWEYSTINGEAYISNVEEENGAFVGGFLSISVGKSHVCSIFKREGAQPIYCWGANWKMQLGNSSIIDSPRSHVTEPLAGWNWIEVSTGSEHTCGRNTIHEVYCWGSGTLGQLGNGDFIDSAEPKRVILPDNRDITRLVSGSHSNCILFSDGDVYCWGWGGMGQLGNGETTSQSTPLKVNFESQKAMEIHSGMTHFCAITIDEEVYCWGSNSHREISKEEIEIFEEPIRMSFGGRVDLISLGSKHTCSYHRVSRFCLGEIEFDEEPQRRQPEEISSGSGFNCYIAVMRSVHCDGVIDFHNGNFVPLEIETLFVPTEVEIGTIGGIPRESHSLSHDIISSTSGETFQLVITIDSESDWDLDGWKNTDEEACGTDPYDSRSEPSDIDEDNRCDFLDWDDDGDWVADGADAFPNDPNEWVDRDGDGIGANADSFEITIAFWGMLFTSLILFATMVLEATHMIKGKSIMITGMEEK